MPSKLLGTMAMQLLLLVSAASSSTLDRDKAECADKLVALATCLPYVGGDAKTPTTDCCTGLKQLIDQSKKCLCVLMKDRNDPSLGLKINATLAATLPSACRSPANISECSDLLHLPPNSPDAKMFQGFANSTQAHSSAAPDATGKDNSSSSGSTSGDQKSDGGKAGRLLGVGIETASGVVASIVFFSLILQCLVSGI